MAIRMVKVVIQKRVQINDPRVLVIYLIFKEKCLDLRSTMPLDVNESWADPDEASVLSGIELVE